MLQSQKIIFVATLRSGLRNYERLQVEDLTGNEVTYIPDFLQFFLRFLHINCNILLKIL